ncbi:MAG: outer membrane protein assembly factor BamA [Chitinispirillaceae bacterium]|nr:outer membrane protein assembly factor BamA [Chitinispirillaceae bacterium]
MIVRCGIIVSMVLLLTAAGQAKKLDTLVIEGLSINSEQTVRHTAGLRTGGDFSTTDIQDAIRRLHDMILFRKIDFYSLSETDSTAALKLVLEEFPVCDLIEYHGNKKLKKKDLEEKSTLKRGQILSDAALFDEEQRILVLYAEKGYNLAEVRAELIPTKIPGNSIVKFSIKEGPRVRIKAITFKGNKDIKTAKLLRKFKTKESRWWRTGEFKREAYREHLDTLLLFYNDLGYLDASIVKDSVWYADTKKDLMIEITIEEGKKYFAGNFFFQGNAIIPTDSLKSKIALKYGKPFQRSRFELSKYLVENTYREEGYLWVQVSDERTYRGDTIDVMFDISEGRSAIVRKIDVKGNTKTMEKVVRREIDLLPGKKYKQSLMMRSRQKIMALGFFGDVKPDLIPNDDGTIDLIFDITEKDNIGQLQIGAAFSAYNGFIGTFSTSIPNFRGAGQELNVKVEYGKDYQDFSVGFVEPWAFDRPISLSGRIFYSDNSYYSYYAQKQWGFSIGSGLSKMSWPDDHFRLDGAYQFSYEEGNPPVVSDVPEFGLHIQRKGFLSRLSFSLTRYDLDIPLFPTEGSKLTISPQIAGLGGNYRYLKGIIGYEHYFPLPLKLVFGTKTKVGYITWPGRRMKISQYDLFRLGGVYWADADLRGYEDLEFGGLAGKGKRDYGHPENGRSMFATTLELRYPLLEQQLYLGVFADGGNTWPSFLQINPFDLYKSVGFGIRINIPMLGLMGVDFGWGLDDPTPDGFDRKPNGFKLDFMMNRGF